MLTKLCLRFTALIELNSTPVRLLSKQNIINKDVIKPMYKLNVNKTRHTNNNRNARISRTSNERVSIKGMNDYEKNFIFKGRSNRRIDRNMNFESEDEDFESDPEKEFELEQDLDLYSRNKNLYHKKVIQEDISKRKQIKHSIIMKRMKKLEGNQHTYLNLLTWDAKEQIKYLHLNDSDYWTVEKIVESFPITEESCRKLLKSKWAPKTLDDLARHDQKVIENWKKLTQNVNTEPSGPAINIYEEYKRTNRLALLKNACGLPDVEFKRKALIHSDSFSIHESILCKPGKFSMLVHRNREEIEKLFNSNKSIQIEEESKKKMKTSWSIDNHFILTKQELVKSLAKLSNETSLEKIKKTGDEN